MIEVKNLTKRYGTNTALNNVSFTVEEGTIVGFLGPNGAGKSTTIDTLCTLNSFDSGEATIAGFDLRTQAGQIKNSIGAVFQDSLLDKTLTVRENLMLRARFYHKTAASRKEAVARVIEWTDLNDFIDRPYGKLSGGQRRRADIARALLKKPKILILDDSTSAVDTHTDAMIRKAFKEEIPGTTKLIIAQRISSIQDSNIIIVMENGQVACVGDHETLMKNSDFYRGIYESQQKGSED